MAITVNDSGFSIFAATSGTVSIDVSTDTNRQICVVILVRGATTDAVSSVVLDPAGNNEALTQRYNQAGTATYRAYVYDYNGTPSSGTGLTLEVQTTLGTLFYYVNVVTIYADDAISLDTYGGAVGNSSDPTDDIQPGDQPAFILAAAASEANQPGTGVGAWADATINNSDEGSWIAMSGYSTESATASVTTAFNTIQSDEWQVVNSAWSAPGATPVTLTVADAHCTSQVDVTGALVQANNLQNVADSYSESQTDPVALVQDFQLTVNDAFCTSQTDAVEVTERTTLTVADAFCTTQADAVATVQDHQLTVADASCVSQTDAVALVQDHHLTVADAFCTSQTDAVSLGAAVTLAVNDAHCTTQTDSVTVERRAKLIAKTNVAGTSAQTTSGIDTTGADFLLVVLSTWEADSNFSDSKSNTWQSLTRYGDSTPYVQIKYVYNPTVGTNHTVTNTASYHVIAFYAFSGMNQTSGVYDAENGATDNANGQSGTITPAEAGELLVGAIANGGGDSSLSVNSPFTMEDHVAYSGGSNPGLGVALYNTDPNTNSIQVDFDNQYSANAVTIASFALVTANALTVNDVNCTTQTDAVDLVQDHHLTVDDASCTSQVDAVSLGASVTLTVADASCTTQVDAVVTVQDYHLTVDDAFCTTQTDNVTLVAAGALSIADAYSESQVDAVDLVQDHHLVVADASVTTQSDSVDTVQDYQLVVADASVTTQTDEVQTVQDHHLVIADAFCTTQTDNVTLAAAGALVTADASCITQVDAVSLTQKHTLSINDASVTTQVDAVNLTGAILLIVADASVTTQTDAVGLTQDYQMTVADASCVSFADAVTLAQKNTLVVADSYCISTVENVSLSYSGTILEEYSVSLPVNITPVISLTAQPSPVIELTSNPSPAVGLKVG